MVANVVLVTLGGSYWSVNTFCGSDALQAWDIFLASDLIIFVVVCLGSKKSSLFDLCCLLVVLYVGAHKFLEIFCGFSIIMIHWLRI